MVLLVDRFYTGFGQRVAAARAKLDVSQGALGRRVGLSRTSIVNIEKGRQRVLLHTALDLADALEVPLEHLIPPTPDADLDTTRWVERILSQRGVTDNGAVDGRA